MGLLSGAATLQCSWSKENGRYYAWYRENSSRLNMCFLPNSLPSTSKIGFFPTGKS